MKFKQEHLELADAIRCTPGQISGYCHSRETSAQMIADMIRENVVQIVKERNKLKRSLREHTEIAKKVIAALDAEMKKPSDFDRGKRIAKIVSVLEFENDKKRHFDLDEEFPLSR